MIALQIIPQVIFLPVPTAATSLTQMGEFGAQSWVHFWCIVISFLARFTRASVLKPLWCSQSQLTIYLYVRRQELCVIFLVSSFRSSFILTFQNKMKKRSCLRYLSAAHVYMYIYVCAYHTIIQYSELEKTHKDFVQLLAPCKIIHCSNHNSKGVVWVPLKSRSLMPWLLPWAACSMSTIVWWWTFSSHPCDPLPMHLLGSCHQRKQISACPSTLMTVTWFLTLNVVIY